MNANAINGKKKSMNMMNANAINKENVSCFFNKRHFYI